VRVRAAHIFRVCYARFCHCLDKEKHLSHITLNRVPGARRGATYGRRDEEYIADFVLVSRRYLDAAELRVFKAHFLLSADWKLCCRQFGLEKGEFFHIVYRIMAKLGRIFAELEPYALYPLEDYYDVHCSVELPVLTAQARERRRRALGDRVNGGRPVVPPVRTAA
jgi:hypothetical protein